MKLCRIKLLLVIAIFILSALRLFCQIDTRNQGQIQGQNDGATNFYNIVTPNSQATLDRTKFSFTKDENKHLGRKSFEIVKINLSKGRPEAGEGNIKSLPFDVPFYLEGDVSQAVNEVYIVAVERYKTWKRKLNSENDIKQFIHYVINANPNSNSIILEKEVKFYLDFNTWKRKPDVKIGHWKKPMENLVVDTDSLKNTFSVLIPQIESGKKYDIYFVFRSELSTKKKSEIVSNGVNKIISNTDMLVFDNELINRYGSLDSEQVDRIVSSNFNLVFAYVLKEFKKNNFNIENLKSNYLKLRDVFLQDYKREIDAYVKSKSIVRENDLKLSFTSDSLILKVKNINCEVIRNQLDELVYKSETTKSINSIRGIDGDSSEYEYAKRIQKIKSNIASLEKIDFSCLVLDQCCEKSNKISFIKLKQSLVLFSKEQIAILNGNSLQKEKFIRFLKLKGNEMLNDIASTNQMNSIPFSSDDDFLARSGELIMPDFGFMYQNSSTYGSQMSPFFGVHLHMVRVNRESKYNLLDLLRPSKELWCGYRALKPLSLTTGFTFLNDYGNDRRRNLISGVPVNMYLGLGLRVSDYGRLNIGRVFYREVDENPLRNSTTVQSDAFVSFSVDFYVNEFLGNTFKWLF